MQLCKFKANCIINDSEICLTIHKISLYHIFIIKITIASLLFLRESNKYNFNGIKSTVFNLVLFFKINIIITFSTSLYL